MRCAYSWAARPVANGCLAKAGLTGPGRPGGDIACAVAAPDGTRLIIGDVMGHDRRAARTAAAVARRFRQLAARPEPLQVVARRLHEFVARRATAGEFVTAQLVSVPRDGGEAQIVCCGHPSPLLLRGGRATLLDALPPSPPLGLLDLGGYPPRADLLGAGPGDSVLLYTDGVSEARDAYGQPYPLAERAAALRAPGLAGPGDLCLTGLLDDAANHCGGQLRDDATLLYLRFAAEGHDAGPMPAAAAGPAPALC